MVLDWEDMLCFYFFVILSSYFQEFPANCGSKLVCDSSRYRAHLLHKICVCGSSYIFCIFSHLYMGPRILGNYCFCHTDVMLLDKVVSYNNHIMVRFYIFSLLLILPLGRPSWQITSTTSPLITNYFSIRLSVWNLRRQFMLHWWSLIHLWWKLWLRLILWRLSCCVRVLGLARWYSWVLNKIHHVHLVL